MALQYKTADHGTFETFGYGMGALPPNKRLEADAPCRRATQAQRYLASIVNALKLVAVVMTLNGSIVGAVIACDQPCKLERALTQWDSGKTDLAKANLIKLANEDFQPAQVALGEYYIVEEKNLDEGRRWLRPLAENGDSKAQVALGTSYIGRGRRAWNIEEVKWLRAAAAQNNQQAREMLALGHKNGWWSLKKDPKKAETLGSDAE